MMVMGKKLSIDFVYIITSLIYITSLSLSLSLYVLL